MELINLEVVGKFREINVREKKDNGEYHQRVLLPDADVSGEVQEIQEKAEAEWTSAIKTAYITFRDEQEAERVELRRLHYEQLG